MMSFATPAQPESAADVSAAKLHPLVLFFNTRLYFRGSYYGNYDCSKLTECLKRNLFAKIFDEKRTSNASAEKFLEIMEKEIPADLEQKYNSLWVVFAGSATRNGPVAIDYNKFEVVYALQEFIKKHNDVPVFLLMFTNPFPLDTTAPHDAISPNEGIVRLSALIDISLEDTANREELNKIVQHNNFIERGLLSELKANKINYFVSALHPQLIMNDEDDKQLLTLFVERLEQVTGDRRLSTYCAHWTNDFIAAGVPPNLLPKWDTPCDFDV